ncbi:MAG: hypothetical protein H0W83_06265 [Planctomycetes bacterium]|nr:hypothetical protein [Planctomycetota bacterium]
MAGEPWDDIVRVDRSDPRFFSCGGRWYWPIGLNLRSPNDLRSHDNLHTAVTPDRGTYSYHAYLERFARSGGTATEVWMAPWSLGLEWNSSWFGFHGLGRYSQSNAWRLEHVLDDALAHGVRINLVISNHGQASSDSDREWQGSPYNAANGGPVAHSPELFTDSRALAMQDRSRRYIVARYADHPGVMGWKLWSEVNLTPIGANSVAWHRQAADRWHGLDVYRHPVTTHWADDYRSAELAVVSLPQLDFACIDAYYRRDILADVLMNSTLNPARGLARFGKPILVSEYGGREFGAPSAQLAAELACSGFASLVSGHAGMPMLWWWEWVDQGDRWAPYGAIARFIDGEDIRGTRAGSAKLYAIAAGRELWCHAWRRQGRILGYVLDPEWVKDGVREDDLSQGRLQAGVIDAGGMAIEWWDADRGERLSSEHLDHLGGGLTLPMPTFRRHLAFKLIRDPVPGP